MPVEALSGPSATMPPMSDATAEDYRWLDVEDAGLIEAYCLTFVRGRTPEAVLEHLRAEVTGTVVGVEPMHDAAFEVWDVHGGDRLFAGATAVGDWTVMVEPNGYLGTFDEVMLPLSADGGRVVSHFRNVDAVDHFHLWDDGVLRLHFEPLFAVHRDGPDAETLVPELLAAGFNLDEDGGYEMHTEAAWALGERLTGVRITPETLTGATFLCGVAPAR